MAQKSNSVFKKAPYIFLGITILRLQNYITALSFLLKHGDVILWSILVVTCLLTTTQSKTFVACSVMRFQCKAWTSTSEFIDLLGWNNTLLFFIIIGFNDVRKLINRQGLMYYNNNVRCFSKNNNFIKHKTEQQSRESNKDQAIVFRRLFIVIRRAIIHYSMGVI